jgi:Rad3-related DNA helicase
MAKYVYGIAKNGGTFYCEAPTGIGKTMSTLYPAVKAFADTDNERIFYLTAKTSGREPLTTL